MFKTQLNPEHAGFFAALPTLFVLGQPGSHWFWAAAYGNEPPLDPEGLVKV